MKFKSILLMLALPLISFGVTHNLNEKINKKNFKFLDSNLFYKHIDFNYNSTVGANFNLFQGHSNLYGLSGSSLFISKEIYASIGIYHINSNLKSQTRLGPTTLVNGNYTIKNNTLYAHIGKVFNKIIFIDLTAGYGHNKTNANYLINPNAVSPQAGSSNYNSNNWFASIATYFSKSWQPFTVNANINLLYNQFNSPNYQINYQNPGLVKKRPYLFTLPMVVILFV